MGRLVTVAMAVLTVSWTVTSAFAQRGGASHGSFFGHSGFSGAGSAVHAGFRGFAPNGFSGSRFGYTTSQRSSFGVLNLRVPAPYGFNLPQRYPPSGTANVARGFAAPGFARRNSGNSFAHSESRDGRQHHGPQRPPYRRDHRRNRDDFFQGGVIWPSWINTYGYFADPDFLDYAPDSDYNDSSDSQTYESQLPPPQDYGSQPPGEQQPEYAPPPAWPSLPPPQSEAPPVAPQQLAAPPQPSEPVTIVFNNGTPPEKIHNYLLTKSTLYVLDEQRREIPVNQLDLASTARVNREAGIDFQLPGSSK